MPMRETLTAAEQRLKQRVEELCGRIDVLPSTINAQAAAQSTRWRAAPARLVPIKDRAADLPFAADGFDEVPTWFVLPNLRDQMDYGSLEWLADTDAAVTALCGSGQSVPATAAQGVGVKALAHAYSHALQTAWTGSAYGLVARGEAVYFALETALQCARAFAAPALMVWLDPPPAPPRYVAADDSQAQRLAGFLRQMAHDGGADDDEALRTWIASLVGRGEPGQHGRRRVFEQFVAGWRWAGRLSVAQCETDFANHQLRRQALAGYIPLPLYHGRIAVPSATPAALRGGWRKYLTQDLETLA